MLGHERKLMQHLLRYSSSRKLKRSKLYREWRLIEVRDAGKTYATAKCPCGRKGLRYICFLRNRKTGTETYIGSNCAKHFHRPMARLLQILESLCHRGIRARFNGARGNKLMFQIPRGNVLIRNLIFLRKYFGSLPYSAKGGSYQICVRRSYGSSRGLHRNKWYVIKLAGATNVTYRTGCNLHFYLTRFRRA